MFSVPFSLQPEAEMEAFATQAPSGGCAETERSTLHTPASPSSLMSHTLFIHAKRSRHNTQTHLYPSIKNDGASWPPAA